MYTELKSQDSIVPIFNVNYKCDTSAVFDLNVLQNNPNNFVGGKIGQFRQVWKNFTSDSWVIKTISGSKIDFCGCVDDVLMPHAIKFDKKEAKFIDEEVKNLLAQNIIQKTEHSQGEFISSIFLRPKKDGKFRMILNLKNLNKVIVYEKFKMETLKQALCLVTKDCFFASIDLSQAYYACPVHIEHQKLLRFIWKNQLYQFNCFVNGLAEAPRKFTKIMKVPFSYLKTLGHSNIAYIDDSLLLSDSYEDCCRNISDTVQILDSLGFTIHPKKSVLYPSNCVTFLGYEINSINMTVRLTDEKLQKTLEMCDSLLRKEYCTIRDLAKMIGKLVSAEPGVPLAPLFYKPLEKEKMELLSKNGGIYDARIVISKQVKDYLQWWQNNLTGMFSEIDPKYPEILIRTDSSDFAWGGINLNTQEKVNGMWSDDEKRNHINFKELDAIFLCLQSFVKDFNLVHIRVESDNTTAVAYINNMGGKFEHLDQLARKIWFWAIDRNIWLSAAHIPGIYNVIADTESRTISNVRTEWQLNPIVFKQIQLLWPYPEIDLFASRINTQLPKYVSWNQDPGAIAIDAMSFSWNNIESYIFAPFSMLGRVLAKLTLDEGSSTLVAPIWKNQFWWPKLLTMVVDTPRILGGKKLVTLPWDKQTEHPLRSSLHLAVFRVSGKKWLTRAYRNGLPSWQNVPGGRPHVSNMGRILKNGVTFVCKGKLITIIPL